MKLRYRGRTDVGKTREHNEDDYGFGEGAHIERLGDLLVVCDGMGGHAAGEVASHLAVETVIASYYADAAEDRPAVLRAAFEHANQRIHTEGRGSMGTTGVAALVHQGSLVIANVGDSRAYMIRDGAIQQISRDHSLVSEQVAAGVITAEQARSLYYRNVITRALGYQPEVSVDLFSAPLRPGDLVVLCSDGLHGLVEDEEIRAIAQREPLEDAVDALVDLANDRGGSDNITVVIARVDELDGGALIGPPPTHDRETVELPAPSAEAPLALASAAAPLEPRSPAPISSAPRPAAPRRLGPLGVLLSTAVIIALGAAIFFMSPSTATAPAEPAATATAEASAAPTTLRATEAPSPAAPTLVPETPIPATRISATPPPATRAPTAATAVETSTNAPATPSLTAERGSPTPTP